MATLAATEKGRISRTSARPLGSSTKGIPVRQQSKVVNWVLKICH